jgi:hypothetical protein
MMALQLWVGVVFLILGGLLATYNFQQYGCCYKLVTILLPGRFPPHAARPKYLLDV